MILTQGEKMIWAATFAGFRLRGLRTIGEMGEMTQENADMVARQSANAATDAVLKMRELLMEADERREEEASQDEYDEDMLQMLRAMLGDEG